MKTLYFLACFGEGREGILLVDKKVVVHFDSAESAWNNLQWDDESKPFQERADYQISMLDFQPGVLKVDGKEDDEIYAKVRQMIFPKDQVALADKFVISKLPKSATFVRVRDIALFKQHRVYNFIPRT